MCCFVIVSNPGRVKSSGGVHTQTRPAASDGGRGCYGREPTYSRRESDPITTISSKLQRRFCWEIKTWRNATREKEAGGDRSRRAQGSGGHPDIRVPGGGEEIMREKKER